MDPRTDLYAVGAVLYEMIAGVRAVAADSLAGLVHRILNESPRPLREARPGVSEDMARVVERCLEKNPGRRFASATALARALVEIGREAQGAEAAARQLAPARGAAASGSPVPQPGGLIRSLAVLPLENRSGDPAQEFFVDGPGGFRSDLPLTCAFMNGPKKIAEGRARRISSFSGDSFSASWTGKITDTAGNPVHYAEQVVFTINPQTGERTIVKESIQLH